MCFRFLMSWASEYEIESQRHTLSYLLQEVLIVFFDILILNGSFLSKTKTLKKEYFTSRFEM